MSRCQGLKLCTRVDAADTEVLAGKFKHQIELLVVEFKIELLSKHELKQHQQNASMSRLITCAQLGQDSRAY